ncbi:MAG: gamma-glutamylcyclotransferase [Rhodobacteraceae bacterium]|nr:gamma-glutamylcyclotransferase [Paracoccaceae bacterium]
MTQPDNPFCHLPELKNLIQDPEASPMRALTSELIRTQMRAHGVDPDAVLLSDEDREASRRRFLEVRAPGDLWVFAYGSLMWNPGFLFTEVRRAHAPGYARRMLIKDTLGGRGTHDAPGMIAGLDVGDGCDGMAFRIAKDAVEAETAIIWTRERSVQGYHTHLIPLETPQGPIEALAFVVDHDADLIDATLTRDEKIQYIATGAGFLGTSLEYVSSLDAGLRSLGLEDAYITDLLTAARAYSA